MRLIERVTSDEVIDAAYEWLCNSPVEMLRDRRHEYHHNNDVWSDGSAVPETLDDKMAQMFATFTPTCRWLFDHLLCTPLSRLQDARWPYRGLFFVRFFVSGFVLSCDAFKLGIPRCLFPVARFL